MALKPGIFKITCECCGAKISVDPVTKTVFHTEKEGMKKRTFEEVVEDVTSVGKRAEEKFKAGLESDKDRVARLDKLFDEATKKAAENPDERPPNIFDYD